MCTTNFTRNKGNIFQEFTRILRIQCVCCVLCTRREHYIFFFADSFLLSLSLFSNILLIAFVVMVFSFRSSKFFIFVDYIWKLCLKKKRAEPAYMKFTVYIFIFCVIFFDFVLFSPLFLFSVMVYLTRYTMHVYFEYEKYVVFSKFPWARPAFSFFCFLVKYTWCSDRYGN